ncbi:hypothetical protein BpHYR1_015089 [Brachionus plicatilis]|uniref:Uncharacterized protein n=1 Tax=Brachionus plicatilis TaxID=10195 RepID=A0A3M7PK19_BRAPC|nr:hypothetical protein BpHYR1_015089 [Brachionus plicatilis]
MIFSNEIMKIFKKTDKIFYQLLQFTQLILSYKKFQINNLALSLERTVVFELSERYVRVGLSHSVQLMVRLVEEYREDVEPRYIEYPTPLFCSLVKQMSIELDTQTLIN